MLLAFSALLDSDDQIVMADPYYACYPNFVCYIGARPLLVPAREEDGFKLQAAAVKEQLGLGVKGIMLNSPANPTGAVLEAEDLQAFAELGPYLILLPMKYITDSTIQVRITQSWNSPTGPLS